MVAFALVIFFALILTLGWIFFDEDDWGKPKKQVGVRYVWNSPS